MLKGHKVHTFTFPHFTFYIIHHLYIYKLCLFLHVHPLIMTLEKMPGLNWNQLTR